MFQYDLPGPSEFPVICTLPEVSAGGVPPLRGASVSTARWYFEEDFDVHWEKGKRPSLSLPRRKKLPSRRSGGLEEERGHSTRQPPITAACCWGLEEVAATGLLRHSRRNFLLRSHEKSSSWCKFSLVFTGNHSVIVYCGNSPLFLGRKFKYISFVSLTEKILTARGRLTAVHTRHLLGHSSKIIIIIIRGRTKAPTKTKAKDSH